MILATQFLAMASLFAAVYMQCKEKKDIQMAMYLMLLANFWALNWIAYLLKDKIGG